MATDIDLEDWQQQADEVQVLQVSDKAAVLVM